MELDFYRFDRPMPLDRLPNDWRPMYMNCRYLASLSDQALTERLSDITDNFYVFDRRTGKYKLKFHLTAEGFYRPVRNLDWQKIMCDCYFEFEARRVDIPKLRSHAPAIEFERKIWKQQWASREDLFQLGEQSLDDYQVPEILFRYSDIQYNRELFYQGKLRVAPASTYKNDDLAHAVSDNETSIELANPQRRYETDDFLTVCFSAVYDFRMFYKFKADSCLVIKDRPEFEKRINDAIEKHNKSDENTRIGKAITCPIIYYDPFDTQPITKPEEIFLMKHFRFAYQHEYRLVILPTKLQPLMPYFLELGPLTDIAELVYD